MTHRKRYKIIQDILEYLVKGPKLRTHIMYNVRMSHAMTMKYLNMLAKHGLITYELDGRIKLYYLTGTGKTVYDLCDRYELAEDNLAVAKRGLTDVACKLEEYLS